MLFPVEILEMASVAHGEEVQLFDFQASCRVSSRLQKQSTLWGQRWRHLGDGGGLADAICFDDSLTTDSRPACATSIRGPGDIKRDE